MASKKNIDDDRVLVICLNYAPDNHCNFANIAHDVVAEIFRRLSQSRLRDTKVIENKGSEIHLQFSLEREKFLRKKNTKEKNVPKRTKIKLINGMKKNRQF